MSTAWPSERVELRCRSVLLAHLLPARAADAIEHVALQGAAVGHARVVEIAGGIAMPMRCMTWIERRLAGALKDTISPNCLMRAMKASMSARLGGGEGVERAIEAGLPLSARRGL